MIGHDTTASVPPPERARPLASEQRARLRQFLAWIVPCAFGLAAFQGLAFALFQDLRTGSTALIIWGYGLVLMAARRQATRMRVGAAVTLICTGLLVSTGIIVLLQPALFPTLALVPLVAVTVALPYISGRALVRLIVLCWAVTGLVLSYGEFLAPRELPASPTWFSASFRLVSFAAAVGLALLLLWQFSSRLIDTLAQTRAAEARYSRVVAGANDGIWDWDLVTNQVYFSARWQAMLGYPAVPATASPDDWLARIHPDDRARVAAELAIHRDGLTEHFESEYRMRDATGNERWMLSRGLAVRDDQGAAIGIAGSQTDITGRKQIEAQLVHQALHDPLTGLPNRSLFTERLERAITRRHRYPESRYAVLLLDLDNFKVVNDSLGHPAGDGLLIGLARRLALSIRPSDTVARLGGDEFAVLLESLDDSTTVARVTERLQAAVAAPFPVAGGDVFAGMSIGIALSTLLYRQTDEVVRDADTALYRAKAQGRGRAVVFDPSMHAQAMTRLQVEMDLRRALERQEFVVAYQPIVALASGHIVGFEALVRWRHPQRGLLTPADFLDVAEETGLIVPIGHWVLREACAQLRRWDAQLPGHAPLRVNVNMSGTQLVQPELRAQLEMLLQEVGVDMRRVCLEITEHMMVEPDQAMAAVFAYLHELGVAVCVDDFGMGYSSLSALHRFPITVLKIDRAFVSRIGEGGANSEMVQTIVTLAQSLDMDVVAEGVDTAAQLAYVRQIGCTYAQGYFVSPPIAGAAAQALVAAGRQW